MTWGTGLSEKAVLTITTAPEDNAISAPPARYGKVAAPIADYNARPSTADGRMNGLSSPKKIMAHSLQLLLCQSSHEHGDERGGGGGGQCGKKYTFMPPATMRTPVIPIGGLYADCSAAMP